MRKFIAVLLLSITVSLPALAHEGGHKSYGVVKEVTPARLVVTDEHGKDTVFGLTSKTEYLREQKPTSREKIMVGERVVVKGRDATGQLEATSVSVGGEMKHQH
jgi:hypothetical protein